MLLEILIAIIRPKLKFFFFLSYTWIDSSICSQKCRRMFDPFFLLSYLACSQIWLSLPVDHNLHFGYITKLSKTTLYLSVSWIETRDEEAGPRGTLRSVGTNHVSFQNKRRRKWGHQIFARDQIKSTRNLHSRTGWWAWGLINRRYLVSSVAHFLPTSNDFPTCQSIASKKHKISHPSLVYLLL